jgi:hypothetical protein
MSSVSSRDPHNRPKSTTDPESREQAAPSTRRAADARDPFFNVDPADIDRYLTGRPLRQKADSGAARAPRDRTGPSGTARQLERLQESVNRASRTRQERSATSPQRRQTTAEPEIDNSENTAPGRQTAYAAQPTSPRANRRQNVKWRDPYVDEVEPETDDPYIPGAYPDDIPDDFEYADDVNDDAEIWDQPRPPRRQPRPTIQRPSFQRPNIQKPSLPPAIANADLVNDASALGFIGISCLSLAAMAIIVANRVSTLDPVIATHVSASGIMEHFTSRTTVWQLPLLATMMTLMNLVAAWFVSPLDRFASRFLLATSIVVQFVTWVAVFRILW